MGQFSSSRAGCLAQKGQMPKYQFYRGKYTRPHQLSPEECHLTSCIWDQISPPPEKSQLVFVCVCVCSPRCPLDPDQCRTNAICNSSSTLCPHHDSVTILNPTSSSFLFFSSSIGIFFFFSIFYHTGLRGQTRPTQGPP